MYVCYTGVAFILLMLVAHSAHEEHVSMGLFPSFPPSSPPLHFHRHHYKVLSILTSESDSNQGLAQCPMAYSSKTFPRLDRTT
jgi:hypothetical protein